MRLRILALLAIAAFSFPLAASAGIPFFGPIIPPASASCPAGWGLLIVVINNIISLSITIAIVFIAPLMIAYAGFLYVVNPVNPSGKEAAKKVLSNTVIGIVIALAGWLIVDAIMIALYNPGASSGQTRLGAWSTLISTGGSETCLKIAGTLQPARPGVTPGVGVVPPMATDEQSVRDRLKAAGVTVNKPPCTAEQMAGPACGTSPGPSCTNVAKMQPATIQQIINIANTCGGRPGFNVCGVQVTGGTEPGHACGPSSHERGFKVDLWGTPMLDEYLKKFTRTGRRGGHYSGDIYEDTCRNEYVRESNPQIWDITVRQACGGTTGPVGGACPAIDTVDPPPEHNTYLRLRFALRPGQIGSKSFLWPPEYDTEGKHTGEINTVIALSSETPLGLQVEMAVSQCKGSFDVPPGCMHMGGAYSSLKFGPGTSCLLTPGTWYYNIRYPNCIPSGFAGFGFPIDYCATYSALHWR